MSVIKRAEVIRLNGNPRLLNSYDRFVIQFRIGLRSTEGDLAVYSSITNNEDCMLQYFAGDLEERCETLERSVCGQGM